MLKLSRLLSAEFLQQSPQALWQFISPYYCPPEAALLEELTTLAKPSKQEQQSLEYSARKLIESVRADNNALHKIDALLLEYGLDNREGVLLMCLAESLMRIPDRASADALIKDKLSLADWSAHQQQSDSLFVNASTWGLMLGGKLLSRKESAGLNLGSLFNRLSEQVIRAALQQAMKIMGSHFVLGQSIEQAAKSALPLRNQGYCYSFDMLGEAALSARDAERYYQAYHQAICHIATERPAAGEASTISIKISALHPRYEVAQRQRVFSELFPRLLKLLEHAKALKVPVTIDAEEADRLELSLQLFAKLLQHPKLQDWGGLGLAVQAYSKRALPVLAWLASLAKQQQSQIPVRLVKGAYWDTEIKLAQQAGLQDYPVYTQKAATDVSYLACARLLLQPQVNALIYPQFASHNAHTIAAVLSMAGDASFEFQRLHGMGDALYQHTRAQSKRPVRIYAPVGAHQHLLPYLVRRLLENGANSSFVHRLVDATCPVEVLLEHPIDQLKSAKSALPLPSQIFAPRHNSSGRNINVESQWLSHAQQVHAYLASDYQWQARSLLSGPDSEALAEGKQVIVEQPAQPQQSCGNYLTASPAQAKAAVNFAAMAQADWAALSPAERCKHLLALAQGLEQNQAEFTALLHREAGKTSQDAIDEIREAVDFLRYYAEQAPLHTERSARGVVLCISPWNFPLAIFIGQIAAALVTGNTVVAKPAEQTSLVAHRCIELWFELGLPRQVLQLVLGEGKLLGPVLLCSSKVAAVTFTGSLDSAQQINQSLAARGQTPVPLIAETGGVNVMIVDSTALIEQVVKDVLRSAFASAGQRCSALRVLCVQQDLADELVEQLQGAMQELKVGSGEQLCSDLGPVISATALAQLQDYVTTLRAQAPALAETPLSETLNGHYLAPCVFEVASLQEVSEERFGPILHLFRFRAGEERELVEQINSSGYGLTLGVHSRNEQFQQRIAELARVGNIYINRDQVGAVVASQPFGGMGLSGTGPKAGGPHYLARFTAENEQLSPRLSAPIASLPCMAADESAYACLENAVRAWQDWKKLSPEQRQQNLVASLNPEQQDLHQLLEQQAQQSQALQQPQTLSSVTGEHNQLRLLSKGVVLLHADMHTKFALLVEQVFSALVCGNSVILVCEDLRHSQQLEQLAVQLNHQQLNNQQQNLAVLQLRPYAELSFWLDQAVAAVSSICQPELAVAINQALAHREGAIINLHWTAPEQQNCEDLCLEFLTEQVMCTNTSAIGGNTQLLGQ